MVVRKPKSATSDWEAFALAAKGVGLQAYYNGEVQTCTAKSLNMKDKLHAVLRRASEPERIAWGDEDQHRISTFCGGMMSRLHGLDLASSPSSRGKIPIDGSVWQWPQPASRKWQRRLFNEISKDAPLPPLLQVLNLRGSSRLESRSKIFASKIGKSITIFLSRRKIFNIGGKEL